jgi:hypothetical protein
MTSPTRSNSSGSPAKKSHGKRVTLTATQKQEICQYHCKNPKLTQEELAQRFGIKFNLKVNRLTIGRVLTEIDI